MVYLLVAAFGFIVEEDSDGSFRPVNDVDDLLHVGLSLGMILVGVAGTALQRKE